MREPLGDVLREGRADRREEYDPRGSGIRRLDVSHRLEDGRGLHEHALPTAERGIVDRTMPVMRPVAKVVGPKLEDALVLGTPHD